LSVSYVLHNYVSVSSFFKSIQLGVGEPGGSERAARGIQLALEECKEAKGVLISTDFKNAYNTRSRRRIAEILYKSKGTEYLWRLFRLAYGTGSDLEISDEYGILHATIQSLQKNQTRIPRCEGHRTFKDRHIQLLLQQV
jgi:hypothetical protein